MNKSARKRFKEAGYKYVNYPEDRQFAYVKIDEFDGEEEYRIAFDLDSEWYWFLEPSVFSDHYIDIEQHKLIHYQLEELGWL